MKSAKRPPLHQIFRDLCEFADCVDTVTAKGSFVAAAPLMRARGWGGGQPRSSRLVTKLERLTGRVLKRTTRRGIEWTDDAKAMARAVRALVGDVERIVAPRHPRRLRIAATNTLLHHLVTPFLGATPFLADLDRSDDDVRLRMDANLQGTLTPRRKKRVPLGHRTDVELLEGEWEELLDMVRTRRADVAVGPLVANDDFEIIPVITRGWTLAFSERAFPAMARFGDGCAVAAVRSVLRTVTVCVLPDYRQPGYAADKLHAVLGTRGRLIIAPSYGHALQLAAEGVSISIVPNLHDLYSFGRPGKSIRYVALNDVPPAVGALYLRHDAIGGLGAMFGCALFTYCASLGLTTENVEHYRSLTYR